MLFVFRHIGASARSYAAFRKTRAEIARLPLDVALDLDLYPGDAGSIAHAAVYGQSSGGTSGC